MIPKVPDLARCSGMRLVLGESGRYSTTTGSPSLTLFHRSGRTSYLPSIVCPSFVVKPVADIALGRASASLRSRPGSVGFFHHDPLNSYAALFVVIFFATKAEKNQTEEKKAERN
jgi:hypothetical protein